MQASSSKSARRGTGLRTYLILYSTVAALMIMAHLPLIRLPYYWDELGQFIPASLDLFHGGHWIPVSTLPNVHPPALMAWLASVWSVAGYSIVATRIAMLLIAAAGALCTFLLAIELSRHAPGTPAFTAVALLVISPLFFAQSMLAQLDMPAMCLTALALLLFLQNRFVPAAIVCTALTLTKETGVIAAGLFFCWLSCERRARQAMYFAVPFVALALWLAALKQATGHWFGNAQFTDYNLFYPLNPARLGLALLRRLYYLFIGSGHFFGTAALCVALRRVFLFRDRGWRIAASFAALHVLAVCVLGGAVLERYLLPVLPLLYIAFAIALASLSSNAQRTAFMGMLIGLTAANFIYPPYPFPFENNLAFSKFVEVQQNLAEAAAGHPGTVWTAFPLTDALLRPEAGYVEQARRVVKLEGFRQSDLEPLRKDRPDVLIVFDTVWDPLHMAAWDPLNRLLTRFYGYERPLTADEIAALIPMRVVHRERLGGLSGAVLVR